jgi:Fuc2NAc and GlcNAc transferase
MIYVLLLILSFSLTYFIRKYALKKSLLATINERSSHTVPTPHGGGIAIAITWFVGLIYFFLINLIEPSLFYALLVGAIISIISFVDDLFELSAKLRLVIQSIVAILGLYMLGGFNSLDFLFFSIDNQAITNLFALLMIIWFINLTNFIDGINGYVGSEFVFLGIAGFILFNDNIFLVLGVSVFGFLLWNYNKAKIFMGDVGSTLLGYNIAILTLYYSNIESANFWIWITLYTPFWFDATYTLIRRKINKEKLSQAHKKHAYQRLTQVGFSHLKVTNYLILLNIVLFFLVYLMSNVYLSFLISIFLMILIMKYVNYKKEF